MKPTGKSKMSFGTVIVTASLIIAIIALIPAFLSLNKEKSRLYFSYIISHYETPDGIDDELFHGFLIKNNIPAHRLSLQMKNCGNAPATEIKISVTPPGQIIRYIYTPSKKEEPIWVSVPNDLELGFASSVTRVVQIVKDMAPNRLLVFGVAYEGYSTEKPSIEVFGDGMEATFIPNISEVPLWNPYRVFYIPGYILVCGLALTLLWITGSVILSNVEYRRLFRNFGATVLIGLIESAPFFGAMQSKILRDILIRRATDQGPSDKIHF